MRKWFLYMICLLCSASLHAEWTTFLAYNEVSQIAVSKDKVYALSNGSLFSVDKMSEKIEKIGHQQGLNDNHITNIYYDTKNSQLIIAYHSGKIDVLDEKGITYVSGFYTKDITDDKTVNNIEVANGRAYLATCFGIITFNLRKQEIVDTYYIGHEAEKRNVEDVRVNGDSIYAYTADSVYHAALKDNVVDYRVWHSTPIEGAFPRDTEKGKVVRDPNGDTWLAGGNQGVVRKMMTGETLTYKPNGPAENKPYRMTVQGGRLYVVPGGRWASQNDYPGRVMIYDGKQWTNIETEAIVAKTQRPAEDFMNVAVDPKDATHFFVTSYGTGLYEFRNDTLVQQYLPTNSSLQSAVVTDPNHYTRCDGAIYDQEGNLLVQNAEIKDRLICILTKDNRWTYLPLHVDGEILFITTPLGLLIDNRNSHYIWSGKCRAGAGIALWDNNGTLEDKTDDHTFFRTNFVDQDDNAIIFEQIFAFCQTRDGSLWVGCNTGLFIIPSAEEFRVSNRCLRIRIPNADGYILNDGNVNAILEKADGTICVGTADLGVYVLSGDGSTLIDHYTMDNSSMPSNSVLSLAEDREREILYIGTAEGIAVKGDFTSALQEVEAEPQWQESQMEQGSMKQWISHKSYVSVNQIAIGKNKVYGVSDGALMAVDKQDETIAYIDKTQGLNGDRITHIVYDQLNSQLVIVYSDGMIDFLTDRGDVSGMPDLYQSMISRPMKINSLTLGEHRLYLGLSIGIGVLDPKKQVFVDTYIIGNEGENVDVTDVVETHDSIYAVAADRLYVASRQNNLLDFRSWKEEKWTMQGVVQNMEMFGGHLYVLLSGKLYRRESGQWTEVLKDYAPLRWISAHNNMLMGCSDQGSRIISANTELKVEVIRSDYTIYDMSFDATTNAYWLGAAAAGIIRIDENEQWFVGKGPLSNDVDLLRFGGDKLFVCPGGKDASQYLREGNVSTFQNGQWNNISCWTVAPTFGNLPLDYTSVAIDEKDNSHYFMTSYGKGVFEYRGDKPYKNYTEGTPECPLLSVIAGDLSYVRTDGAMMDKTGNLWVLCAGERAKAINILSPEGKWYAYDLEASLNGSGSQRVVFSTPGLIMADMLHPNYKWMFDKRSTPGVILHDDNGTRCGAIVSADGEAKDWVDDRSMKRTTFIDQENKPITPERIYCMTQDMIGDIWVGTQTGLFILEHDKDFFHTNACKRVIIPRNDGTNLADYLLDNEQVTAIAVDGGNRKWIGTGNSGVYLVSEDGKTTLAHFTINNSLLPSNAILSIAIHPSSGEVFIGTANGIVSYQSDASEAREDYTDVVVYPNPVRPNYDGWITIRGLMDETIVNILDAGGNLVCKTRSNGGTAVWDGRDMRGKRVATGVYTILCNTADGTNHTSVKVLVM